MIALSLLRRRQGAFFGPAAVQSALQGAFRQAQFSFPCRKALSLPVVREISHPSTIVRLLKRCRPSTVARSVIAVVVQSVKRQAWRARSHVSKKGGEVIAPFVAHRNAASAVVLRVLSICIEAAPFGFAPRVVFTRSALSVCSTSGNQFVFGKAPTRARDSVRQAPPVDGRDGSAVTLTDPAAHIVPALFFLGRARKNNQAAVSVPNAYRIHRLAAHV